MSFWSTTGWIVGGIIVIIIIIKASTSSPNSFDSQLDSQRSGFWNTCKKILNFGC